MHFLTPVKNTGMYGNESDTEGSVMNGYEQSSGPKLNASLACLNLEW